jgi:hypothetical protein
VARPWAIRSSPVLLPAAVAAATLVTWIVTVDRMQGMDAGPGIWVAAAPSSVPGLTQPGSVQARPAMRAMGMHGMNKGIGMRKTQTMGAEKSGSMKMR